MEWYVLINGARHALASSDADTPIGRCFNLMTHVFQRRFRLLVSLLV